MNTWGNGQCFFSPFRHTHGPMLRFRCGEEEENLNSTTDVDMDLSSWVIDGNVAAEMVDRMPKKTSTLFVKGLFGATLC